MFKKIASDALGLSDIGKIIGPEDYDKTDADDYVRHEDDEKIYFLIMTKADEYCFTNLALIHVDGDSATSSKRTMKRYPYSQYNVSDVLLETAGRIDLDIEIKFKLGNVSFNIDVDKKEIEKLKDLYKTLLFMAEEMHENSIKLEMANESLNKSVAILQQARIPGESLGEVYRNITEYGFTWLSSKRDEYVRKDYGDVFEKYINN